MFNLQKRLLSLLLVMVMVIGMLSAGGYAAKGDASAFSDMPNDWSTAALENAVNNGLLLGYGGKIMPKDKLTRAQMAAIVNRAFGTAEKAALSGYTDVPADAWYYDDMAKAVRMKTFVGYGGKLDPDDNITREQTFVVLANAFKLSGAARSALDKFSDIALVSQWAKDATASLVSAGYITGSNGQLNPQQEITRAEFAQIMHNILKNYIKASGTYTANLKGNVIINASDVTLKNMTITGDLIIGVGKVTLDGITVTGRTVISGGGVDSIRIIGDSKLQSIVIARVDGEARVYSKHGVKIGEVIVNGSDNVILEGSFGTVKVAVSDVTVIATNADIMQTTINGDRSIIIVGEKSAIKTASIKGKDAKIITQIGSKVEIIVANGNNVTVSGTGTIGTVEANANVMTVKTIGTKVIAGKGATGVFAGTVPVAAGNTGIVGGLPSGTPAAPGVGNSSGAVSAMNVTGNNNVVNNQALQLGVTIEPITAINKKVIWTVAPLVNGRAAINASTGLLTATGIGTVRVTATNADSGVAGTRVITITPTASETALTKRIDKVSIKGTDVYFYIPESEFLGRRPGTAPIFMVFGDENYNAETAVETALASGLANIAKAEGAVVVFANSKTGTWSAQDEGVYLGIIDKFSDSSNNVYVAGVTTPAGIYGGGKQRVYIYAEGRGADFVSEKLMKPVIKTTVYSPTFTMREQLPPTFTTLFNPSIIPTTSFEGLDIPSAAVNAPAGIKNALGTLNPKYGYYTSRSSGITDGFDKDLLMELYKELGGTLRRQVNVLHKIPDYAALGIQESIKTINISTGNIEYYQYIPTNINLSVPKKIPLVLTFHGGGNHAEYQAWASEWPLVGKAYGFMVVSVNGHASKSAAEIFSLLQYLLAQYPAIDTTRIYASGFSMGSVKSFALCEQYPKFFAGIAPMGGSFGTTSEIPDVIMPTFYVGGQTTPLPEFPHQSGASNNIDARIRFILAMNGVTASYAYNKAAHNWWGIAPDKVYTTVSEAYENSISTINTYKSKDGNTYTALVNTSNMSHEVYAFNSWAAWKFLSPFSRNADGSLSIKAQ